MFFELLYYSFHPPLLPNFPTCIFFQTFGLSVFRTLSCISYFPTTLLPNYPTCIFFRTFGLPVYSYSFTNFTIILSLLFTITSRIYNPGFSWLVPSIITLLIPASSFLVLRIISTPVLFTTFRTTTDV